MMIMMMMMMMMRRYVQESHAIKSVAHCRGLRSSRSQLGWRACRLAMPATHDAS
jgi:hypothetical protein